MTRITDRKKCLKYLTQFKLYWGLLTDILILPLVGLMILLTWIVRKFNIDTDNWFEHDYNKQPMLLIHGSGSSALQWLVTRYLYLNKHYNTYTIDFPQNSITSIEEIVNMVAKKSIEIKNAYINHTSSHDQLVLVGMSMGGLVAAYYAETYNRQLQSNLDDKNFDIKKVITINTPLHGTPALEFINMKTVRHSQMTPRSDFINKLHDSIRNASNNNYWCVASYYDYQVPYKHAILYSDDYKFSKNNIKIIIHTFGHMSVILFPKIWRSFIDEDFKLRLNVEDFLTYATKNFDKSHDADHARTVCMNAMIIMAHLLGKYKEYSNDFDPIFLKFCALLHDVIDHKYIKLGKSISQEHLSKYVEHRLGKAKKQLFFDVIDNISYSKQKSGQSKKLTGINRLYQIAVSDADKLEALGKVGIHRCYEFARILYPTDDEKFITKK